MGTVGTVYVGVVFVVAGASDAIPIISAIRRMSHDVSVKMQDKTAAALRMIFVIRFFIACSALRSTDSRIDQKCG